MINVTNKKVDILKKVFLVLFIIASYVLSLFFTYKCLKFYTSGFLFEHKVVLITTIFSLLSLVSFFAILFYFIKKELAYKLLFTCLILYLFCVIGFYIYMFTGLYKKVDSVQSLREYVSSAGKWAVFLYIILQFAQVVVLPIPSIITTLAGLAMFGPLKCTIYSLIGIFTGSLLAFLMGRFLGYKFASWLVGKNELDKWLEKVKGKDKIILSAMFLLPMFPDDILCFVAGLSTMSFCYFAVMIFIARLLAISLTCYSIEGAIIPFNTWWGITIWVVLALIVVIAFVFIYKNGERIENYFKNKFKKREK